MTFANCKFYNWFNDCKGLKYWAKIVSSLMVPYLLIALSYFALRFDELADVPALFWVTISIASIWFVLGPHLVYKFMRSFLHIHEDTRLTKNLRAWFYNNQETNYRLYKMAMWCLTPALCIVLIPQIIIFPQILADVVHITHGLIDPFFWVTIVFLCWILTYCANAISVIFMMTIVVYRLTKNNVMKFNPISVIHQDCIGLLVKFSNRIVSYMCSGLLFLPLIFVYLQASSFRFWYIGIFATYACFLFAAAAYPQLSYKRYVKQMSLRFLSQEQNTYLNLLRKENKVNSGTALNLVKQMQFYNVNLYLQELKKICNYDVKQDIHSIMSYAVSVITIVVAIISGIADGSTVMQVFRQ